jgi:1,4-dihydroxy-2-naphthoyl-CoA hydrolase
MSDPSRGPIWFIQPTAEAINSTSAGSMAGHLGIEFTQVGEDFLTARMPVTDRTRQPLGYLHGGASATLAETLGSVAGMFTVDPDQHFVMGLEINANHVRAVREGSVTGTARPLHIGRTTQVWEIRIVDEEDRLVSISRLTLAVRPYQSGERPFFDRASGGQSAGHKGG